MGCRLCANEKSALSRIPDNVAELVHKYIGIQLGAEAERIDFICYRCLRMLKNFQNFVDEIVELQQDIIDGNLVEQVEEHEQLLPGESGDPSTAASASERDNLQRIWKEAMTCVLCEHVAVTFEALRSHHQSYHNWSGYAMCCGLKFHQPNRFHDHINVHKNAEYFHCRTCGVNFEKRFNLHQHLQRYHKPGGKSTFYCTYCSKSFRSHSTMRSHCRRHLMATQTTTSYERTDAAPTTNAAITIEPDTHNARASENSNYGTITIEPITNDTTDTDSGTENDGAIPMEQDTSDDSAVENYAAITIEPLTIESIAVERTPYGEITIEQYINEASATSYEAIAIEQATIDDSAAEATAMLEPIPDGTQTQPARNNIIYECNNCYMLFNTVEHINQHIRTKHNKHRCENCNLQFEYEQSLFDHQQLLH